MEGSRQDTDDRAGLLTESECLAQHVRVCVEAAPPEAVTDQGGGRSAETLFCLGEPAAKHWRDAHHLQKTGRNPRSSQPFGKLAGQLRNILGNVTCNTLERLVHPVPVFESGR